MSCRGSRRRRGVRRTAYRRPVTVGGREVATDGGGDLCGNLIDLLTRPVLLPALGDAEPDGDLLRRCFSFVEAIYAGAGEYRRGAVYFQVLECLLEEGPYLEKPCPICGERSGSGCRACSSTTQSRATSAGCSLPEQTAGQPGVKRPRARPGGSRSPMCSDTCSESRPPVLRQGSPARPWLRSPGTRGRRGHHPRLLQGHRVSAPPERP